MKELLKKLAAGFDEAEGWIQITAAEWNRDDLLLTLSICLHDDHQPESWKITCSNVVEESLCSTQADFVTLSPDSPLLKSYTEREMDIMFSQSAVPAELLFGILCSCCMEVMGRPESILQFINSAAVNGVASAKFGLLGRFPESLAMRILDALKDRPILTSVLPGKFPKQWDGFQYVDYPSLQALEIGHSYVIAEQFSACRFL